jgi:glycine dehydrogenase subunit 1
LSAHEMQYEMIPFKEGGQFDQGRFQKLLSDNTAAVILQSPNFFGTAEDVKAVTAKVKEAGALTILCANPLAYGLFASAGDVGADIAVGDGQPFGLPLQFGGPYVGYIACRQEFVRQLPGRIVGETLDLKGKKGYVLTLQAREQHIRREKATSNICTNQALASLANLVAILWYGKEGVRKLALTNYQRAAYLKSKLETVKGVKVWNQGTCFNEFVIHVEVPFQNMMDHFRKNKIEPGVDLGRFYPSLQNHLLIAVTETKSKEQLDRYAETLNQLLSSGASS